MSDAHTQWRHEISAATWDFAKITADLHRRKPKMEVDPTLDVVMTELISWWIDYGFSKDQIVESLQSGIENPDFVMEGWISRMKPDA